MNSNDISKETKEKQEKIKLEKLEIEFEQLELANDYVLDRNELDENTKPKIASSGPYRVQLQKDKYYFYCTCGESSLQPFCDGSHKGSNFMPLKFSIKQDVTWSLLCGCKNNAVKSGPFCDGNHINLQW